MKLRDNVIKEGFMSGPSRNKAKRVLAIVMLLVASLLLIGWISSMGKKAEQTVKIVMTSRDIYKNEVINEEMLKEYDMLVGEFEKFSVKDKTGKMTRRILTWDERGKIIGGFAAYPLQQDTYAEYSNFIKSRVDNSDSVMYAFPGKQIVPLSIGQEEMATFKTFLQPGDRLTINVIYSEEQAIKNEDGTSTKVAVFIPDVLFKDIMLADMINETGASILDLYASYNQKTVTQQANLDRTAGWIQSVTPKAMIVAMTPEELSRYYYFMSKTDIKLSVSLPQRVK